MILAAGISAVDGQFNGEKLRESNKRNATRDGDNGLAHRSPPDRENRSHWRSCCVYI